MAQYKSTEVTIFDTLPLNNIEVGKQGAPLRVYTGQISVTTAMIDNTDDYIHMVRLPSNARMYACKLFYTDLDSNGSPTLAFNIGYRYPNGNLIDADNMASAVSEPQAVITAAQLKNGGLDVLTEALDWANLGKKVWEHAGLTSDPGGYIDIVMAVSTVAATAAAGTMRMVIYATDQ